MAPRSEMVKGQAGHDFLYNFDMQGFGKFSCRLMFSPCNSIFFVFKQFYLVESTKLSVLSYSLLLVTICWANCYSS